MDDVADVKQTVNSKLFYPNYRAPTLLVELTLAVIHRHFHMFN